MKEIIIKAYKFNLEYAKELVKDVDESQMTVSPGPGLENHPAFTLGHLISGSAMTSEDIGGPYEMNDEWEILFRGKGPGDPRIPAAGQGIYPSKKELLNELERQHQIVEELIINISPEKLDEPCEWRFGRYFPTLFDLVHFMCVTHEAMHLSQLAAWRRAMGFPSAFAKL